jgi:hypothetical protein
MANCAAHLSDPTTRRATQPIGLVDAPVLSESQGFLDSAQLLFEENHSLVESDDGPLLCFLGRPAHFLDFANKFDMAVDSFPHRVDPLQAFRPGPGRRPVSGERRQSPLRRW